MSNWQETCAKQLGRLEKVALLADKLTNLCSKAQSDLSPDIINSIREERPRLQKQIERLRANRFEVAVIGLEKAGKSALLNAWLGLEILPSAAERCTYTSTEIWSARTENEQKLDIEYFSKTEIDALLQNKKNEMLNFRPGTRDYDDIDNDIKETESCLAKIYEYAAQGSSSRQFKDINEISEDLQQAVFKNRPQARAIKCIQLKTTRLLSDRDIVFHDVPGFDSPVAMHKIQAEQKLSDCDAIIYAKKMDNPNINSPEKNMLQVADSEDPHTKVVNKVFVVLTKSDMARDRSEYDDWLNKHRNDWGGVPESRVVTVCSAAYLAKKGTGSVDTNRYGQQSIDNLNKLNIDDGIDRLKQSVDFYIDHERINVLNNRCNKLVEVIKDQALEVFSTLEPLYNKTIDSDIDEEDLYGEDFGKWWGKEWVGIREEFQNWYQKSIVNREGPDGVAGEHSKLTELRTAYTEQVKNLFTNLISAQHDSMEAIYKETIHLAPIPNDGNKAIRNKLYIEIKDMLDRNLPNQLTGSLKEIIDEIVEQAKQSLFKIDEVERILLENPSELEEQIRHGFEILFLRFGRIAVDTFIALPLHDRPRLLKEIEPEIRTLEAFYNGPNKDTKSNLTDYIRTGLWMVKQASDFGVIPPVVGKGIKSTENWDPFNKSQSNLLNESATHEPQNFKEVVKEIQDDLIALQDYLQNSVFNAAGFITYSNQELQKTRERFITLEEPNRRWGEMVRREAKRHNQNVPFKVDNHIKDFRLRREVALDIKETKDILMQIN